MPVTSAICVPEQGASLSAGRTKLEGYAVAYGRSVARVDVSIDGGKAWRHAVLQSDPGARAAWTLWSIEVDLPRGQHELVVKAVDEAGQSQPENAADVWNFAGYLSTAWHRVTVDAVTNCG